LRISSRAEKWLKDEQLGKEFDIRYEKFDSSRTMPRNGFTNNKGESVQLLETRDYCMYMHQDYAQSYKSITRNHNIMLGAVIACVIPFFLIFLLVFLDSLSIL